ncbi:hypothetical protein Gpo141_00011528 [Globisporangium polare]
MLFAASIGSLLPSLLLLSELERKFVRELPEQCNAILDGQLLLQPTTIHPHLGCMGPVGRAMYLDFYNFDLFLFPVIYSTFLSGSLARVWPRNSRVWLVPVLGALADMLENISMYFLLLQFPQRYERVELAISMFTRTKWFLVALTAVLLLIGGLVRLIRGPGAKEAGPKAESKKAKAA